MEDINLTATKDNKKVYQILEELINNNKEIQIMIHVPSKEHTDVMPYAIQGEKNKEKKEEKNLEKDVTEMIHEIGVPAFEADVKKHIDAIATKYIISGETTDQAIMFLPAEAIFAEINAYHTNIIKYAASKKVWITSPTTLMSLLTIIQTVLKGLERDKYTSIIHDELNKLGVEFGRYKDRWDKLSRTLQTVNNDVENLHITTEKITKRFDSISNVNIDSEDKKLLDE